MHLNFQKVCNFLLQFRFLNLEQKLKDHGFLRTHKSYIVNIGKIREIIPWFNDTFILTLENCDYKEIPVSRHYLPDFKKFLNI